MVEKRERAISPNSSPTTPLAVLHQRRGNEDDEEVDGQAGRRDEAPLAPDEGDAEERELEWDDPPGRADGQDDRARARGTDRADPVGAVDGGRRAVERWSRVRIARIGGEREEHEERGRP